MPRIVESRIEPTAMPKKPGRYLDGRGLYLCISRTGARSWTYRYRDRTTGRLRELGLGSFPTVSLADARKKANRHRQERENGIDPAAAKAKRKREAKPRTFGAVALLTIAAKRPEWKNAKHAAQWESTLRTYCASLWDRPVELVTRDDVLKVLSPHWSTKTETASRVRERMEAVLSYAKAMHWRSGENPAQWRGGLDALLAKPGKIKKVEHHAAVPWKEAPAFLADVLKHETTQGRLVAFLLATATRASEAAGATWGEIDRRNAVWTVPANRMKAKREHRVPLSPVAMRILDGIASPETIADPRAPIFPRPTDPKTPIYPDAARLFIIKTLGRRDLTAHGLRSTFRDWAAEATKFPRELAEAALAHRLKDKTEEAYQRGDLLDRRRELMEAWAEFLHPCEASEKVVTMKTSQRARR